MSSSFVDVQIIMPRRHSVFVPAMSVVDRAYFRTQYDYTKTRKAVNSFIGYLIEESKKFNYTDKKEIERLNKDREKLLYMYICGQRISEWDFELLTEDDYIERSDAKRDDGTVDAMKLNRWKSEYQRRKALYIDLAYEYLKKQKTM